MSELSSELVRQLIVEVGEAGIEEMGRDPGLAAAVDQHTAAVRDVIAASGDELTPSNLLDYLDGFTDTVLDRGWWPADDFDWETIRVIAVCAIMRDVGTP